MAASSRPADDGLFAGINVTPLVDITLVLLIIFMVTAKLIVSQTLPFDLPKAATGSEQQVVFSVSLSASGETRVDSERVDGDDDVLALARKARERHPDVRAVIQADRAVPHGRVVHVMDLLKQGGIGKIAFGVVQEPVAAAASAESK
jgi:biopolymer transport protein ExbD